MIWTSASKFRITVVDSLGFEILKNFSPIRKAMHEDAFLYLLGYRMKVEST